jgi:type IX secretion system PorP/SprF family membrane protein
VELTGSYKIDLTLEDQISFALSPILGQFKFNNDSLVYYDPNDVALQGGMESNFIFDASFGMLIFGPNYMFGFSIPNIFQSDLNLENNILDDNVKNQYLRHYLLMGSYNYFVSDMWALQPSLLTKFTAVTPVQFDFNVKATYNELIWAGISYRHQDAVAVMIGGDYEGFMLGYAYDITITDARNFSPHTHEITVGYKIPRNPGFSGPGGGRAKVIKRR